MDVRLGRGQEGHLLGPRIRAVDQDHGRGLALGRAEQLLQQQGIGLGQADVGVAEARVDLERPAQLGRQAEGPAEDQVPAGLAAPADRLVAGQRAFGVGRRDGRVDGQAGPVGQDGLESDRAVAGAVAHQPFDLLQDLGGGPALADQAVDRGVQADDRMDPAARCLDVLLHRRPGLPAQPGVHHQVGDAGVGEQRGGVRRPVPAGRLAGLGHLVRVAVQAAAQPDAQQLLEQAGGTVAATALLGPVVLQDVQRDVGQVQGSAPEGERMCVLIDHSGGFRTRAGAVTSRDGDGTCPPGRLTSSAAEPGVRPSSSKRRPRSAGRGRWPPLRRPPRPGSSRSPRPARDGWTAGSRSRTARR